MISLLKLSLNKLQLGNIHRLQTIQLISISRRSMSATPSTVGIVVIGDEITKGQVQDCNSFYLCHRFHQLGVVVKAVVTVPDDSKLIERFVNDFSANFTYVVTTGGIGPTHDDITYEAIASAFRKTVKIDEELEALYKGYFKEKYTDTHRKLATIPETASLVRGKGKFPVVNIGNVYILPGVPKFLKLAFLSLEDLMGNPSLSNLTRILYLTVDEMSIASELSAINEEFSSTVSIGSYPEWHNNYYKVKLVLEAREATYLDRCEEMIMKSFPSESFVKYDVDPLNQPMRKLENLQASSLNGPLSEALAICTESLSRFKLNEICIGFNGGKDCTALLHLWYAVVSQHPDYDKDSTQLAAIYIKSETTFPEVELFIGQSIARYKLNVMRFEGGIKDQLTHLKQHHPHIKAVIMGTRSTDPHGDMKPFQATDAGWPQLMRVNPILNFTYNDIWQMLRSLNLPYCSLYDVGYTSLGSIDNTHVNQALRYTDSSGVVSYRPAYTLAEQHLERAGRHS